MVRTRRLSRPTLVALTLASVAAFTASGGGLAASASGSPFTLGPDVKVSGASKLTSCTAGASDDFADAYDNTEVEAQVAVNPTNPDLIFGVSQQDRWADGGAPKSGDAKAPPFKPVDAVAPASAHPPVTRNVSAPCSAEALPPGTLIGLKPSLPKGGSLRLTLLRRDGDEPLLWIKDFDPEFAQTYWLRNPVTITRFSRVRAEATGPCSLTTLLASGTDR